MIFRVTPEEKDAGLSNPLALWLRWQSKNTHNRNG